MLQLGNTVLNFSQQSSQGKIDFYDWAGDSWIVFFSHPTDYTCAFTSELCSVAKLKPQFDKRGVKVVAQSGKDRESYLSSVLFQDLLPSEGAIESDEIGRSPSF